MLLDLFKKNATFASRPAVILPEQQCTWEDLSRLAIEAKERLEPLRSRRVGVFCVPSAATFASLAALDSLDTHVFLLAPDLVPERAQDLMTGFGLEAMLNPATFDLSPSISKQLKSDSRQDGESSVTILTSGTTGLPKAARHTWETLARPVRRSRSNEVQRWALTFRPQLYAGLQVILQVFVNGGTLVVPDDQSSEPDLVQFMAAEGVEFISATPSYWRRLLLTVESALLKQLPLKQITLGGEVVDQPLLNRLAENFEATRLVHIYATTELGRCFSVSDKRAGFPATYLEQATSDQVELKIDNGQLFVRSANAMQDYDAKSKLEFARESWFATGDLVRVQDDRVFFEGRNSDLINVGGNKVNPVVVERVIRQIDGVADARVFAKSSTLAGQLVACEIVPTQGAKDEELKNRVFEACIEKLDRFHRPRIMNIVESIELSKAGKVARNSLPEEGP